MLGDEVLVSANSCAVASNLRMSGSVSLKGTLPLKLGATYRRCEIALFGSVHRNAFSRGNGVKNMPMVGTNIFNLDCVGVLLSWCLTTINLGVLEASL